MTDILGNSFECNCLGCEIGNKNITQSSGIIYEDEAFISASAPEVPLKGFLIVNVKRYIN